MGRILAKQWEGVSLSDRGSLSAQFYEHHQSDIQKTVQSVCSHLSHPLPAHHAALSGDSPQYMLQALHLLYRLVPASGDQRIGAASRVDSVIYGEEDRVRTIEWSRRNRPQRAWLIIILKLQITNYFYIRYFIHPCTVVGWSSGSFTLSS